jgi:hypothetical protein
VGKIGLNKNVAGGEEKPKDEKTKGMEDAVEKSKKEEAE